MTISKHCKYQGNIDELANRFSAFSQLKELQFEKSPQALWRYKTQKPDHHETETSTGWFSQSVHSYIAGMHEANPWMETEVSYYYQALAVFVGKTGYGKSSTLNAFFGDAIMATCDVEACTRECQTLDFKLHSNCYFSLGDLPGIGESEFRDKEYLAMYRKFLARSTVAVYVVRADTRDYSIDEAAYNELFASKNNQKKVIIALNCCDKIEPINRQNSVKPSAEQMLNINKKIESIAAIFHPINPIIPYSATTGWNMNMLAEEIVNVVCHSKNTALIES